MFLVKQPRRLDLAVMTSAFYVAFALRFELRLNEFLLNLFVDSLPIVIVATYTGPTRTPTRFALSARNRDYGSSNCGWISSRRRADQS